jgi:hypothetical protein
MRLGRLNEEYELVALHKNALRADSLNLKVIISLKLPSSSMNSCNF